MSTVGLHCFNDGLLLGIAAYSFELLGFPGRLQEVGTWRWMIYAGLSAFFAL